MNRYALTIEQEYIVYADSVDEATSKLQAFLNKKVSITGYRELPSVNAEPAQEIIDISPINQRK